MPELGAPKGVTKHTELTDKEVAGVIDHADGSVTNAKIATGLNASKITTGTLADERLELPVGTHKAADPIDHPDSSIAPAKLKAIDTPADGEAPTYDAATEKFEWAPAAGLTVHDKTYHKSPTLPDNDAHITASPIEHPDASVTPAKLSFDTWEVVSEVNVTADSDYVDFTGLDGNSARAYFLFLRLVNSTASGAQLYIYVNGDYTDTNYYEQQLLLNGTTVGSNRYNAPYLTYMAAGEGVAGFVFITRNAHNKFIYQANTNFREGSEARILMRWGTKIADISNVTSLRILSSATGGISSGSQLILCKVRT